MALPAASTLVERLVRALGAEDTARRVLAAILRRQASLLSELHDLGLPDTTVAHKLAAARGIPLPLEERIRLAAKIKKRRWRGTGRPADLRGAHGQPPSQDPPSVERALPPDDKEKDMPQLIRRTIEEYVESDEDIEKLDASEDDADEDEGEDGDNVDEKDERSAKRTRRR